MKLSEVLMRIALVLILLGISNLIWVQPTSMATSSVTPNGALYYDEGLGSVTQQTPNGFQAITPSIYGANGEVLGASTTGTTQTPQQQAAAQAQTQINGALAQLPGQQQVGEQNIGNAYGSAFQNLLNSKTAATNNLNNTRVATNGEHQTAVDNIGAGVRQNNTSVQRILGAHGAGNSSAASILGPYAAALQGNTQRGQVQDTYAHNMAGIDQALNNTNTSFDNNVGDLQRQKQQQQQQLQSGIDTTKASLLGQEANPDQNQINQLLSAITQLGLNPSFTPKALDTSAPDISKYAYKDTAAPQLNNGQIDPGLAQSGGNYFNMLLGDQQKKQALVGA